MAIILHCVCAWCRVVIYQGDVSKPWSHGACAACAKKWAEA